MPTTTNFGWTTPADTDLVKDGASAIRTLGNGIDTSLVDLKGGTTGQVLKKNSNTDMDFVWSADSAGMTNPMTTTGDTIYASSGSTPARLAIGSSGQVLTVSGGVPTWANASAGAISWTLLNSGGTSLTAAAKVTVSFSAQKHLFVIYTGASSASSLSFMNIRLNDISTSSYTSAGTKIILNSSYDQNNFYGEFFNATTEIRGARMGWTDTSTMAGSLYVEGTDGTGNKRFISMGSGNPTSQPNGEMLHHQGIFTSSSTITSISFNSSSGNWDAGTVYVYGGN